MNMKNLIMALAIIIIGFALPAIASDTKKILIVTTNLEHMGDPDKPSAALVAKEILILFGKSGALTNQNKLRKKLNTGAVVLPILSPHECTKQC